MKTDANHALFISPWCDPRTHPSDGIQQDVSSAKVLSEPTDPLIFGFWKVKRANEIAYNAIKHGYRRLDSATDYGNEKELGEGIQRALSENICKREDLYVTSKLWNTFHDPKHVEEAIDKTLQDLQLTYLDEYLIHFPIALQYIPIDKKYPPEWHNLDGDICLKPHDLAATWAAMEKLVDAGKCKKIGLSNFAPSVNSFFDYECSQTTQLIALLNIILKHAQTILESCKYPPASLQFELHPHNTEEVLRKYASNRGIRMTVSVTVSIPDRLQSFEPRPQRRHIHRLGRLLIGS